MVVGPDDARAFERFWADHDLRFTGLPDPEHAVLDLYGQQVKLLRLGRLPELVIVDIAGTVRFVHHAASMGDIPSSATLLAVLDELNVRR